MMSLPINSAKSRVPSMQTLRLCHVGRLGAALQDQSLSQLLVPSTPEMLGPMGSSHTFESNQ